MGNGQAEFDSGAVRYFVDLFVTARYDAVSAAHAPRWQKAFHHASTILFHATSGQMQLGSISFLNNGPADLADDDVHLYGVADRCYTFSRPKPFGARTVIFRHVMNQPLVLVHELGHYIGTLGEEADTTGSVVNRVCRVHASTHQCIMEFARDFGRQLDDDGNPTLIQPTHIVNEFCFTPHGTLNNQHMRHNESCWRTLKRFYPDMKTPDEVVPINTHQDIQWIPRAATLKFAIAIPSSDLLANPPVQLAVKNAVKEWCVRVSETDDQLSLHLGLARLHRPMQPVTPNQLPQLFHQIDALNLAKEKDDRMSIAALLPEFHGQPGAYQRMLLLQPGNQPAEVKDLPRELAAQHVKLIARSYAQGAGASDLDLADRASKWIEHESIPVRVAQANRFAFQLQNELLESYFDSTPGVGIVDVRSLNLAPGQARLDFPVWLEKDCQRAVFMLSQFLQDDIRFSVIAPDETIHWAVPRADTHRQVVSLDLAQPISGRWIVRLVRPASGNALPFYFLVASRNPDIATSTAVTTKPKGVVKLSMEIVHDNHLEGMEVRVDVVRVAPDMESQNQVVQSLVLQHETVFDPVKGQSFSTGQYLGETNLAAGNYIGLFRASHLGQAIPAKVPECDCDGPPAVVPPRVIPAFSRVERRRFSVRT